MKEAKELKSEMGYLNGWEYQKAIRNVLGVSSLGLLIVQLMFNPVAFNFFFSELIGNVVLILGMICLVLSFNDKSVRLVLQKFSRSQQSLSWLMVFSFMPLFLWGLIPHHLYLLAS